MCIAKEKQSASGTCVETEITYMDETRGDDDTSSELFDDGRDHPIDGGKWKFHQENRGKDTD